MSKLLRSLALFGSVSTLALASQACIGQAGEISDDPNASANAAARPIDGVSRTGELTRANEAVIAAAAPAPAPTSGSSSSGSSSSGSSSGSSGGSPAPAPAPSPSSSDPTLVFDEVNRELSAMRSSTYSHTTSVDEATGTYDYDCSGFVGYVLQRVLPSDIAAIEAATEPRPLAKDFEHYLSSTTASFTHLSRALDLAPGDVISWLEPADISGNTGHVLIAMGAPHTSSMRSDEVLVKIADSTSTPHGSDDPRVAAGATGLGTGTIGLLVDSSGAPIGYRWKGDESTKDEHTSVALGRVN